MKIVPPGVQAQLAYDHAREEITREVRARYEKGLALAPPSVKRTIEGKIKKEIRDGLSKRFPHGGFVPILTGEDGRPMIE